MRRVLTLSILVLLAMGFASQLRADYRVACPVCTYNTHTTAWYECPGCEYIWGEDAYSTTGYVPPRDSECPPEPPGCGGYDGISPFEMTCNHPLCIGGVVWP